MQQCSFNQKEYYNKQLGIRSYKHEIYTEEVNKQFLNWRDDKIYVIPILADEIGKLGCIIKFVKSDKVSLGLIKGV